MGLLAILDTFLLFKITERRYGIAVALIASVLFAVMPMTWVLRRVYFRHYFDTIPIIINFVRSMDQATKRGFKKKCSKVQIYCK